MLDALCVYLAEKPSLYILEMIVFLQDGFDVSTVPASIKWALRRAGWTIQHIVIVLAIVTTIQ